MRCPDTAHRSQRHAQNFAYVVISTFDAVAASQPLAVEPALLCSVPVRMSSPLLRRAVLPALGLPLLLSSGCDLMVAGHGARAKASDVWERAYEVGESPTLSVSNTNGSVTVTAHEQPRIVVHAERTVQAVTEAGARELLAATTITEEVNGSRVALTTRRPGAFSMGQHAQVRYDIKVPRGASVQLRTTNGGLSLEGVRGVVELETVNGRVSGTGLAQVQRAETVNGSVDLSLDTLPSQGATFETVNGSVELTLPAATAARVEVRTVNGSITVDGFAATDDGERRRRRYDGTLNGGGPSLRVETVNGSVTVRGRGRASTN
jgi:hypothetical protein